MNYAEKMEKVTTEYTKLKERYETALSSSNYAETAKTAPFEFLIGIHTYEALELFNNAPKEAEFYIRSLKEALALYENVVEYRKRTPEMLDKAAAIVEANEAGEALNSFVKSCAYLPESYVVKVNESLIEQATQILKCFPLYKSLYTKKFKARFLESCVSSLNKNDLSVLIENGIIKSADLDMMRIVGNDHYVENFKFLCAELNHTDLIVEQHKVSLKGVSFDNENGSSRQELLKQLKQEHDAGNAVDLKAVPYEYVPEIGNPEPAVRVEWKEETVGNIAKDVVADISGRYKAPQYKVELANVTGGIKEGSHYGCDVVLTVMSTPAMCIETEAPQTEPEM